MAEFMAPDAAVIVDGAGRWTVEQLLPTAFRLQSMPFFANQLPNADAKLPQERDGQS